MKTAHSDSRLRGRRGNSATRQNASSTKQQPVKGSLPASLGDLSSQIWDHAAVKNYLIHTVDEILKQRNVPSHRVISPNMEITIPAIEAMRYSGLRREIAGLIASTMDRDNANNAHPSFLNTLSQLTRDEIRILSIMPRPSRVFPVANLWISYSARKTEILHRNIIPASIARLCEVKSRIPIYIDNLLRLQLIEEPDGVRVEDNRLYSQLTHQKFCDELLSEPHIRRNTKLEKRTIVISGMGEMLAQVCSTPTSSK